MLNLDKAPSTRIAWMVQIAAKAARVPAGKRLIYKDFLDLACHLAGTR